MVILSRTSNKAVQQIYQQSIPVQPGERTGLCVCRNIKQASCQRSFLYDNMQIWWRAVWECSRFLMALTRWLVQYAPRVEFLFLVRLHPGRLRSLLCYWLRSHTIQETRCSRCSSAGIMKCLFIIDYVPAALGSVSITFSKHLFKKSCWIAVPEQILRRGSTHCPAGLPNVIGVCCRHGGVCLTLKGVWVDGLCHTDSTWMSGFRISKQNVALSWGDPTDGDFNVVVDTVVDPEA